MSLRLKSAIPSVEVSLAKEDPLVRISREMQDRGFETLWTVRTVHSHQHVRFTDEVKRDFLRTYAVTGRITTSAVTVGVSGHTIQIEKEADSIFALAMKEAESYFSDLVHAEMVRRGIDGYKQETLGGRNRDKIIKLTTYSDKLLELLARTHLPGTNKKGDTETPVIEQTVVNNQFNFNNLSPADLEVAKKLLKNQASPIEGEVVDDS